MHNDIDFRPFDLFINKGKMATYSVDEHHVYPVFIESRDEKHLVSHYKYTQQYDDKGNKFIIIEKVYPVVDKAKKDIRCFTIDKNNKIYEIKKRKHNDFYGFVLFTDENNKSTMFVVVKQTGQEPKLMTKQEFRDTEKTKNFMYSGMYFIMVQSIVLLGIVLTLYIKSEKQHPNIVEEIKDKQLIIKDLQTGEKRYFDATNIHDSDIDITRKSDTVFIYAYKYKNSKNLSAENAKLRFNKRTLQARRDSIQFERNKSKLLNTR